MKKVGKSDKCFTTITVMMMIRVCGFNPFHQIPMQMTQEYNYIIVQPWSLVCSLKVPNKDRPFINGLYSTLLSVLFQPKIEWEILNVVFSYCIA